MHRVHEHQRIYKQNTLCRSSRPEFCGGQTQIQKSTGPGSFLPTRCLKQLVSENIQIFSQVAETIARDFLYR